MSDTRLPPLAAVTAFGLLLFMLVPATVYVDNVEEFTIPPASLLPLLLVPVLLLFAAMLAFLRLGKGRGANRATSLFAALAVAVWVQSYLLVWELGLFDGTGIDWSQTTWQGAVDLPVWLVLVGAALLWPQRTGKPLLTAAVVLAALQATVLAFTFHAERERLEGPARLAAASDAAAMARFSPERNVIHLLLDAFQADIFREIIDTDRNGVFAGALRGFTFFENNLGTYAATHLALPAMLSGRPYRNEVTLPEYMDSVFKEGSVLNAAHDSGYEVDLVAGNPWQLSFLTQGRFEHAYLTHRRPLVEEAARVLDYGLFRSAPRWVKPWVYRDQRWLARRAFASLDVFNFFYFYDTAFLADIARNLAVDREKPVYKFMHLMATHAPYGVTPDCRRTDRAVPRMRESVIAQSRCTLLFVVDLLNRLKAAGIYDDSLIMIVGDHGSHIPPTGFTRGTFTQGNFEYELTPEFVGLATPLLAIKPPRASHPFRVSGALTSSTNIAATIDRLAGLAGGLPGESVFDARGTPDRHFFGYLWSRKDIASRYIEMIHEYRITGSAYNADAWRHARTYLPPGTDEPH